MSRPTWTPAVYGVMGTPSRRVIPYLEDALDALRTAEKQLRITEPDGRDGRKEERMQAFAGVLRHICKARRLVEDELGAAQDAALGETDARARRMEAALRKVWGEHHAQVLSSGYPVLNEDCARVVKGLIAEVGHE